MRISRRPPGIESSFLCNWLGYCFRLGCSWLYRQIHVLWYKVRSMTIAKNSREFKALDFGDSINYVLTYTMMKGERKQAGLVAVTSTFASWMIQPPTHGRMQKERTGRYCDNQTSTGHHQVQPLHGWRWCCRHATTSLSLNFHSTIIGQNRWWLKLFFCLLDVGTSNALVLYNEAMKWEAETIQYCRSQEQSNWDASRTSDEGGHHKWAICRTCDDKNIMCGATTMHILQFEGESSQNPIYMCKDFGVPYYCIGSGKTDKDCFASAHEKEEIRETCIRHYRTQQTNTRKDLLKKRW